VAFGVGGDVITGDTSGRIFVWIRDSSDAFVVDKLASENLRHAHEVSASSTPRYVVLTVRRTHLTDTGSPRETASISFNIP